MTEQFGLTGSHTLFDAPRSCSYSASGDERFQQVTDRTGKTRDPAAVMVCELYWHVCAKNSSSNENYQRFLEIEPISASIRCRCFVWYSGLKLRKAGEGVETRTLAITLTQVLAENSPGSMQTSCKNVITEMKLFHFSSQYITVFFPNLVSFSSLVSKWCICSQKEKTNDWSL